MAQDESDSMLLLPDGEDQDQPYGSTRDASGNDDEAALLLAGSSTLVEGPGGPVFVEPQVPESSTTNAEPAIPRKQLWLMAPVLALGIALMTADAAVEFASYFQIGSAFNQLRHVSWLTIAYINTVTVSQPLYSRFSDIYSRKPILLFSYCAFGVGTVMCTLSFNFWLLVISRGVVGSGSGGMGYMVTIILNDIIPLRQRALWQSGIEASVLVGQVLGGVLGSLIVDKLGWRRAFLLELPLVPILLIWGTYVIRLPKQVRQHYHRDAGSGRKKHLQNGLFDITGTSILVLALVSLVLALNLGGNDLAWRHPLIPILFVMSFVLFAVFARVELKFARVPLVPIRLLVTSDLLPIMGTVFFANGFLASLLYAVPYYINVSGRGTSHLGGIMNVLISVGQVTGQVSGGAAIKWTGRPWNVLIIASVTSVLSAIWIRTRWSNSEGAWENILPIMLSGLAVGAIMGSLLVSLLKGTQKADRAIIYGSFHIFSSTASMATISCVSTIIQNQFAKYLHRNFDKDFTGDIDKLAEECMRSLKCLDPFSKHTQSIIRGSFVQAMSDSFNLVCGIAVIIVMMALTVKRLHIDHHDE